MNSTSRPKILIDTAFSNTVETFQSETLRPILKMQNKMFIAFFDQYLSDKKILFADLESTQKTKTIHLIFKKDMVFKSLMIGIVCGQMDENEYLFYLQNKQELNKRITAMIIERVISQKS